MSAGAKIGSALVTIWLIVGALAALQRGYFEGDWNEKQDCARFTTTLVTIVTGVLNYTGLAPKLGCPDTPEPSRS